MEGKHRQATLPSYILNLIEVLSESIEQDPKELARALEEEGMNKEEIIREGLKLINDLDRRYKFAQAKRKQKKFLELLKSMAQNPAKMDREEILNALGSAFSAEEFAVLYHKLESIDDEGLKNILKEAESLKKFETQRNKK